MEQRNASIHSTFVNALNSFQGGIPPEIVCILTSFLFVLVVVLLF